MADEYSLTLSQHKTLEKQNTNYFAAWSAESGEVFRYAWVGQQLMYSMYYISRLYLKFPLSEIPSSSVITSASISLSLAYSHVQSENLSSFRLTIVEYTYNDAIATTYNDFGIASLGTLTITDSMSGSYDIVLNSSGLQRITDAIASGEEYVYFGLRSDQDIQGRPPDKGSTIKAWDYISLNAPISLDIITSTWPDDRFPDIPEFPNTGYMDIDTYAVIKAYIEDLTHYISEVQTGDNIVLASDAIVSLSRGITLAAEEVSRNDLANGFKLTSLSSDSTITTCTDVDIEALTNNTLTISGNAAVTGDLNISSTGYASVKEQIEHDNLWWEATGSTPSVDATKAKIYQEQSTGDLKITINSGGSTKTAILADFSGL